jgi:transcriptional regulator with XRE-family HTH domain
MKDRIRQIMEHENLTPAKFADKLQISRAVISHILNGRNNPSLDVVLKILSQMDYINPEWLLTGKGPMYIKEKEKESATGEPDLFSRKDVNAAHDTQQSEERTESAVKSTFFNGQQAANKAITTQLRPEKKIDRIIIYYDDNTYETFIPDKMKN